MKEISQLLKPFPLLRVVFVVIGGAAAVLLSLSMHHFPEGNFDALNVLIIAHCDVVAFDLHAEPNKKLLRLFTIKLHYPPVVHAFGVELHAQGNELEPLDAISPFHADLLQLRLHGSFHLEVGQVVAGEVEGYAVREALEAGCGLLSEVDGPDHALEACVRSDHVA